MACRVGIGLTILPLFRQIEYLGEQRQYAVSFNGRIRKVTLKPDNVFRANFTEGFMAQSGFNIPFNIAAIFFNALGLLMKLGIILYIDIISCS